MPRASLDAAARDRRRDGIAEAPSSSQPGVTYTLHRQPDGTWTCNCPGYGYRGHCSHADAREADDRGVRAQEGDT